MARLTTEERKKTPTKDFAGPGRTFPLTDKEHDRKALQLAPRSEHAGNISKATEERIESKARAKLGESKKGDAFSEARERSRGARKGRRED